MRFAVTFRNTYARAYVSIMVGLSFGLGLPATGKPILDHPTLARDYAATESLRTPPTSAFHSWEEADREAKKILDAWQSEPSSLAWTRIQLDRYVKHKMMPTRGARGLALVHVAMHDAQLLANAQKIDVALSVSMAAAQVLGYLFVSEERSFDRIVYSLAAKRTRTAKERLSDEAILALSLGYQVGNRVIEHAQNDRAQRGWNGARLQFYGEGRLFGPGTWQPTPPYFYYPPDEPFAPLWRPWTLKSADEFRPTPPAFGSQRYLADLKEVIETNTRLTDAQLKIARFWVDGHGSVTPSGHWNQITIEAAVAAKLSDVDTLRLFAVLNIALADTFIAVWDTKYHYWTARPITVARAVFGEELKPPILTPPFPSYVSGHAAFSGAAAHVLGHFIPSHANKFNELAEEAADSRLLGGIHFRHDNEDGITLGRSVAKKVLAAYQ
jgi:hypothetical protein